MLNIIICISKVIVRGAKKQLIVDMPNAKVMQV